MKKLAMHKSTDVRIVTVEKETPKFYIISGTKFKKIGNATPDKVAVGWGSGTFSDYVLSEIDSDVIKEKLLTNKRHSITREVLRGISSKFTVSAWSCNKQTYFTLEQAKHLNKYLDLGLEIDE